ncbi:hypothetical protein BN903_131 [Halorubrum sp. AJ67]|nr:hypothetical protein BN903_131 [Halorubrum sp. AJ67]
MFVGRVDDPAVERPPREVGVDHVFGEPARVGVEPDRDDAVDRADPVRERLEEVHTRPASAGTLTVLFRERRPRPPQQEQ